MYKRLLLAKKRFINGFWILVDIFNNYVHNVEYDDSECPDYADPELFEKSKLDY